MRSAIQPHPDGCVMKPKRSSLAGSEAASPTARSSGSAAEDQTHGCQFLLLDCSVTRRKDASRGCQHDGFLTNGSNHPASWPRNGEDSHAVTALRDLELMRVMGWCVQCDTE